MVIVINKVFFYLSIIKMTSRAEKIDRYPNKININVSKIQNLVRILFIRKER